MGDDESEDLRLVLSSSESDDEMSEEKANSKQMYTSQIEKGLRLKPRALSPVQISNKILRPATSRNIEMVSAQNIPSITSYESGAVISVSSHVNIQTTKCSNNEVHSNSRDVSYPQSAVVSSSTAKETEKRTELDETNSCMPDVEGGMELKINDVEEGKSSNVGGIVEEDSSTNVAGPQARCRLSGLLQGLQERIKPNKGKLGIRDECGPEDTDIGDKEGDFEEVHSEEKKKFACNKLTLKTRSKLCRRYPKRNVNTLKDRDFYFVKCDNGEVTQDETNSDCEMGFQTDPLTLPIKPCSVDVENYFGNFDKSYASTIFKSMGLDEVVGKEIAPELCTVGAESNKDLASWQIPGSIDMGSKLSKKRVCSNKLTRRGKLNKNSSSTDKVDGKTRSCDAELGYSRSRRDSKSATLTNSIRCDIEQQAKETCIATSSLQDLSLSENFCGNLGTRSLKEHKNKLSLRRSKRRTTQISTMASTACLPRRIPSTKTKVVVQPYGSEPKEINQCYLKKGFKDIDVLNEFSASEKSPSLTSVPEVLDDISVELQKMFGNEEHCNPVNDINDEDMALRMIFNTSSVVPGNITTKMKCVSECEVNQTKVNLKTSSENETNALYEFCFEGKVPSSKCDEAKSIDFVNSSNRLSGLENVNCNQCTMEVDGVDARLAHLKVIEKVSDNCKVPIAESSSEGLCEVGASNLNKAENIDSGSSFECEATLGKIPLNSVNISGGKYFEEREVGKKFVMNEYDKIESSKLEELVFSKPVAHNHGTINNNEFDESYEKWQGSCEDSLCEDDFSFEEFHENDADDTVINDEQYRNEFFQELEDINPVEGVVSCVNDDAIDDKEVVSINNTGGGKNYIETLNVPKTADRALPVTTHIAEKIEDANKIVTCPYLANAKTGVFGSEDTISSMQSSVKDKSIANTSDSLAIDTMRAQDSRPYSGYLNDSEIKMSSTPMPYPNNRSSPISLSPLRVSDMTEPPSLLVQVPIPNENFPSIKNTLSQSCYSPIVDEYQKEFSTFKDKLPGTTHLPVLSVLSDLSKRINEEPVVKDVCTDFELVTEKNKLISPFKSVGIFSSTSVSTPVLKVLPVDMRRQVLKDNLPSTHELMSKVINSSYGDELGDLSCPYTEKILTDKSSHGELELQVLNKVADPGIPENSYKDLPDLGVGQSRLFEDEDLNLSGDSEKKSNLKQELQMNSDNLNFSIEGDTETSNNVLPDQGQIRLFEDEDLNLSGVSEEKSIEISNNASLKLETVSCVVDTVDHQNKTNVQPPRSEGAYPRRILEGLNCAHSDFEPNILCEDDVRMVIEDLNLSTESEESSTVTQDIAQCGIARSENPIKTVELPQSVGNIREAGEFDLTSTSKDKVEIECALQLAPSAVEISTLNIEVPSSASIGSVHSSKTTTAPENIKSDDNSKKNVENRGVPGLSLVEQLAKDIVANILPASRISNSLLTSVVPSKISLQSPSITSSTGPIIPPVPFLPMPGTRLDDVSISDSSDDDTGVVILEETVVDTNTTIVSDKYCKEGKDDASQDENFKKRDGFAAEPRPCLVSADVDIWQDMSKVNKVKKRKLSRNSDGRELKIKKESHGSSTNKGFNKLSKDNNESQNCAGSRREKADRNEAAPRKKFKIPKGPAKFPGYDAHSKEIIVFKGESISVRRFMKQEDVIPNCSSFLNDDTWKKVEAMYDKVENIAKFKEGNRETSNVVDDVREVSDLEGQSNEMKNLKNDLDRKQRSKKMFQNVVASDPGDNLSYHGYRRTMKVRGEKLKNLNAEAFYISGGRVNPLLGYKCISKIVNPERMDAIKTDEEVNFKDHGLVMKKLFVHKFIKKFAAKKTLSDTQEEDFLTYLKHYKTGQEETSDFLAFYSPKKVLKLDQVKEVVDLESQFSTFLTYYGEAEEFYCKDCKKKHKFCQ